MVIDSDCLEFGYHCWDDFERWEDVHCAHPVPRDRQSIDVGHPRIQKWRYGLLALLVVEGGEEIDPQPSLMAENWT